jgi:3-hydroxybutyryl-CoA dehydrogenase
VQKELVEAGRLGRKSGQGFYNYSEGSQKPEPATAASASCDADTLIVEGNPGPLAALVTRLSESGLKIIERDGPGRLHFGDAVLALTDGRMATERAAAEALQPWPMKLPTRRCTAWLPSAISILP